MKKAGAIYQKYGKENITMCSDVPTRRKESLDNKSIYTQDSHKDSVQQIRSIYVHSHSSEDQTEEQINDTITKQYHTFGSISMLGDSCFDSLDIYNKPQSPPLPPLIQKLTSLQTIFKEIKTLRSLQTNKSLIRELSSIQNTLLGI